MRTVLSNQISRRVNHLRTSDCIVMILERECTLVPLSYSTVQPKDLKTANTEGS